MIWLSDFGYCFIGDWPSPLHNWATRCRIQWSQSSICATTLRRPRHCWRSSQRMWGHFDVNSNFRQLFICFLLEFSFFIQCCAFRFDSMWFVFQAHSCILRSAVRTDRRNWWRRSRRCGKCGNYARPFFDFFACICASVCSIKLLAFYLVTLQLCLVTKFWRIFRFCGFWNWTICTIIAGLNCLVPS